MATTCQYEGLCRGPAVAVALAASAVRRVVAVSCNQASFAGDARTLVDAGFALGR